MLTTVSHFFLSECLWSITNGGYHTPINIFVMIGLCVFIFRQRAVPAVLLSVSANLLSFFILIGLVYYSKIEYVPDHDAQYVMQNIAWCCMYLGIIYAGLQSTVFCVLRRFYTFNLSSILIATWMSNALTAWIMFRILSQ